MTMQGVYVLVPREVLTLSLKVIGEIDMSQAAWYEKDARLAQAQLKAALAKPSDDLLKAMGECCEALKKTNRAHFHAETCATLLFPHREPPCDCGHDRAKAALSRLSTARSAGNEKEES